MDEQTTQVTQTTTTDKVQEESQLMNVSVRGWITVGLVLTVCVMSVLKIDIKEPMYTLVVMAVTFYLGSKTTSK